MSTPVRFWAAAMTADAFRMPSSWECAAAVVYRQYKQREEREKIGNVFIRNVVIRSVDLRKVSPISQRQFLQATTVSFAMRVCSPMISLHWPL